MSDLLWMESNHNSDEKTTGQQGKKDVCFFPSASIHIRKKKFGSPTSNPNTPLYQVNYASSFRRGSYVQNMNCASL